MFPLTYGNVYRTPADHQPPDETALSTNADYPNLNSRDYARRPLNHALRIHASWECIAINRRGQIAIGTNKLSGRKWSGSLWGYERAAVEEQQLSAETACYKLQCGGLIAHLQFSTDSIVVMGLHSGSVQVWSTHSEVRNPKNPYSLFKIGQKTEHGRPLQCLDVLKADNTKLLTGCKGGTLKVWDMGAADLTSTHTFRFAHTAAVSGVDSSPHAKSLLATCSLDKSALLWDLRQTRPAIALFEQHDVRFKDVRWAPAAAEKASAHVLWLGDECGWVHGVDSRQPLQLLSSEQYFDCPIRKLAPNRQRLAVLADTNVLKVIDAARRAVVYESAELEDLVRDCVWHGSGEELLSVGYDAKLTVHHMPTD